MAGGGEVWFHAAVSKARTFVKYWLPVLLWMAVIFSASSDRGSFQHSSRIVAPLVRWLFPQVSDETLHAVVVVVRKAAHVTEYAVLALLVLRLVRGQTGNEPRAWRWPDAGRTMLVVVLYAATDEFHQIFVPTRQASVWDVLLDSTGGLLALLLVWGLGRWRKRW